LSLFQLEIRVTPRPGVLDPQGQAIHHALRSLGYEGARDVRVGKAIHIELDAADEEAALAVAEEMCRKLLANPVTEDFRVESVQPSTAGIGGAG
jgi:phosphoribosylformylglycinamidine synthase